MNTKHTQGPWSVRGTHPLTIESKVVCQNIATCYSPASSKVKPTPEMIANANLIAASPDLLAACRKAEAELTAINKLLDSVPGMPRSLESEKELRDIRAAIAKAEGGSGENP